MSLPKIGISIGDVNGVGIEVIIKTFHDSRILNYCTPIVYGSSKVISYHKNIVDQPIDFNTCSNAHNAKESCLNVINCWQDTVNITLGKPSEQSGQFAIQSLEAAVKDLKENKIDALVTAPINKNAMQMAGFTYTGHTEYLAQEAGKQDSLMLMVSTSLKVGLVTNHLPISEVASAISKEKILHKIKLMTETLKMDFGIERPLIAVLGLNPHAGDDGLIGKEENEIIRPAVVEAKKSGAIVNGPFPADGFFGSGKYNKYDGILAMYHDQGLIPFKALSFGAGVNFTAGLSFIRTSPDHGTAYDIAGTNQADSSSFRKAIFLAIDISKNRKQFETDRENTLKKQELSYDEKADKADSPK